jgi:ABC-type multidrug transport system ATPase subunit
VEKRYLEKFALSNFADTKAAELSGGNKRKLCCAMAMIGNPKVIFIDEATTGVDPASRRIIWRGIKSEGRNSAVVYTTHAMEEAEEISSKLTVMVKGAFKCFGTLQDIKKKFGEGFEIKFNLQTDLLLEGILDNQEDRYLKTESEVIEVLNDWIRELKDSRVPCGIELSKEFDQYGLFRR